MGKYFKEDNNQRVSKASNLNIEALAENSIRLVQAQWWQRFLGRTTQRTMPTKQVGTSRLRINNPSSGETTFVNQLGKGVFRYVGDKEIKTSIFSQLISSFINNPIYKLLSKLTIANFEKNRPIITQILDTAYDIPFVVKTKTGPTIQTSNIELRDLLAQMIRNNNKIVINGNPIDALDAKTYRAIMADIQKLDNHAQKYDLYRAIPGATLVGGVWTFAKLTAKTSESQQIDKNQLAVGLGDKLVTYIGTDLNTFKEMSAPNQQNALNKITDQKLKKQIIEEAKKLEILK